MTTEQRRILPLPMYLVIGALSALGPIALDLYLPGLPDLAAAFGTSSALAQFSLSATLIGIALGQLFIGPISDRLGRRKPILVGMTLFIAVSILCALSPTIWWFLIFRFLEGLTASAGIVLARASVRDLYSGSAAARVYSRLMLVMGLAPILSPIIGGQILRVTDWRGVFYAIALIGLVILAGVYFFMRETHPTHLRHEGSKTEQAKQMVNLLRHKTFVAYVVMVGMQGAMLFTYISMSSFAFRDEYSVSPQGYSLIFAINGVGFLAGSQLNGAVVVRYGTATMLRLELVLAVIATSLAVAAAAAHLPVPLLVAPLFLVLMSLGAMMGNTVALALTPYGHVAGAASALLGTSQFIFGAFVPSLVSILGTAAWVMGSAMLGASAIALLLLLVVVRPGRASRPTE